MRILVFITDGFGGHGGIALYNRDFLTALCEMPGCDEVVVLPRLMPGPPEPMPDRLTWVTNGLGSKVRYIRTLFDVLARDRKFDLIVCGHINLLPVAWLAKMLVRAPLLMIIHGIDAWHPTGNWLINRLVMLCDAVTSTSSVTRDRFLAWARMDPGRVYLLPNAIHLGWYGPGAKPAYLLDRYRLHGKRVLLTLGRMEARERYKGFDEVLAALAALPEDISYLMVGDGSDRVRLEEKARELGVTGRVVFAGFVPESEKADHYRLADLYVMPSYGEGFGFVFLEALACGIPCIGSTMDGSRNALREGSLGQLVDPGDQVALHAAILDGLQRQGDKIADGLDFFSFENFSRRLSEIIRTTQAARW